MRQAIWEFIIRMFSAEHPIRAAFADALLVLIGNLAVWDTAIDFARMQGRNLDGLQYDAVGTGILLGAVMTLPFSAAALITTRFIRVRREPSLQPKLRITLTVAASIPFGTAICTALLFRTFNHDSLLVGVITFGLCAVPAAFRLTGRTAFVKRGWYRDNPSSYYGSLPPS